MWSLSYAEHGLASPASPGVFFWDGVRLLGLTCKCLWSKWQGFGTVVCVLTPNKITAEGPFPGVLWAVWGCLPALSVVGDTQVVGGHLPEPPVTEPSGVRTQAAVEVLAELQLPCVCLGSGCVAFVGLH